MRTLLRACALLLLSAGLAAADGIELVYHPRQTEEGRGGAPRFVVKDPEGKNGTAQAAIPGKSRAGGVICTFYSYARPAGRYRTTWRAKVDDNAIEEVVLRVSTGGGGKGFDGGSLEVKGTDFGKAGVYQEFSCTAEKGEGGFFTVTAVWPGKGEVRIDKVAVVSEQLFTEKELIERQGGMELPDRWILPHPSRPCIHIGKGLWWRFFGLDEAIPEMGGAVVNSSYHRSGQAGKGLRGFPGSWEQFMSHNLVVLANVDAPALGTRGRVLLEEHVRHGGSLLVCGGPFAFQRGGYRHTALDRLLPCEMLGNNRVRAEGGLVMRPAEGAEKILPADLSWEMAPRVYYYHPAKPRPGATVLVTAGDEPLLVVWQVGEGRVAALLATAEGDPPPDQLAFWDWGDMPRLVASVSKWLVDTPRDDRPVAVDQESRKKLEQLLIPPTGKEESGRERLLADLLSRCRDKAFARELLDAVSTFEGTPDRRFTDALAEAVRPFVDAGFKREADSLIRTGEAGKAALGIRVLGMCRAKGAGRRLAQFLKEGTGALKKAGGGGLDLDDGLFMGPGQSIGGSERVRLAAAFALGDLGDPDAVASLRKTTAEFAKKRQNFAEINEQSDINENIYQQSLASRCRLGDGQAAGPFLKAITKNGDEIEQFQNSLDIMLVNKDDKNLMHKRRLARIQLPVLHRRQALCLEMLGRMPYSIAADFVEELSRRNDPELIPYAYAALIPSAHRKPSRESALAMLPLLRECRTAELQLLVFRIASDLDDPEVTGRIASVLTELASAPEAGGAWFALRRAPQLGSEARPAVIAAALRHPSEEVRRLAKLSLPLLTEEQRKALPAEDAAQGEPDREE